jgi:hypothetical protein
MHFSFMDAQLLMTLISFPRSLRITGDLFVFWYNSVDFFGPLRTLVNSVIVAIIHIINSDGGEVLENLNELEAYRTLQSLF